MSLQVPRVRCGVDKMLCCIGIVEDVGAEFELRYSSRLLSQLCLPWVQLLPIPQQPVHVSLASPDHPGEGRLAASDANGARERCVEGMLDGHDLRLFRYE